MKLLRIWCMFNDISQNSMAMRSESAVFVFISIDSDKSQRDHLNPPGSWALNFGASFARNLHPREGENAIGALPSAVRIRHDLHTRHLPTDPPTDQVFTVLRDTPS